MRLSDARPGMAVVYCPKHGQREDGTVTSVGEACIFVRFANQPAAAPGKACMPWDLEPGPGERR